MVLVTLAPGAHVVVVVPVDHDGHLCRARHDAAHRQAEALVLSDPGEAHAAPYLSSAASGSTLRSVPGSCASGAFRTCSASDTVTLDDPGGSGRAPNCAAPGCFPNRSFARTGAAGLFCSVAGRITGTL